MGVWEQSGVAARMAALYLLQVACGQESTESVGVSVKLTIQTPAVWLCVFKSQIIPQSNNYTIFICYEKAMSINNNLKELDFAS